MKCSPIRVAICLLASMLLTEFNVLAMNYGSSSAGDKVRKRDLDSRIINLLETKSEYKDFYAAMNQLATAKNTKFTPKNVNDVYNLYNAISMYDQPCNTNIISILVPMPNTITAMRANDIKLVMRYLLQENPTHVYAFKCMDEFDELARQVYSQDSPAIMLMTELAYIKPQPRMIYLKMMDNLNINNRRNVQVIDLIRKNALPYFSACVTTLTHPGILRMHEMFTKIMSPITGLRTDPVIERLRNQINEVGPNTIKVMCLVAFCTNVQIPQELLVQPPQNVHQGASEGSSQMFLPDVAQQNLAPPSELQPPAQVPLRVQYQQAEQPLNLEPEVQQPPQNQQDEQ